MLCGRPGLDPETWRPQTWLPLLGTQLNKLSLDLLRASPGLLRVSLGPSRPHCLFSFPSWCSSGAMQPFCTAHSSRLVGLTSSEAGLCCSFCLEDFSTLFTWPVPTGFSEFNFKSPAWRFHSLILSLIINKSLCPPPPPSSHLFLSSVFPTLTSLLSSFFCVVPACCHPSRVELNG